MREWFSVDKDGLAKLMARKGKAFIVHELLQNCFDEDTTTVSVEISRAQNSRYANVVVLDDNPKGFADLTHAFTLFAESAKKSDAEKRGRFNLGEKLVIAMCDEARITSTTGAVHFDAKGRHTSTMKTTHGSEFWGSIKMSSSEIEECIDACMNVIAPEGIEMIVNGTRLCKRPAPYIRTLGTSLPTEIAGKDGVLTKTRRNSFIELHETDGRKPWLYEMGIPVVEIEGKFHVNVMQKVPLTFDRDNVPASFLSKIYAIVLDVTANKLSVEDVNQAWVKDAMQTNPDLVCDSAVREVVKKRFGDMVVSYDLSDPEANNIAVAEGYSVVHGGTMSKIEWEAVRRADAIKPAGQVTPSKPSGGEAAIVVPVSDYSDAMLQVCMYAMEMAKRTLDGIEIKVRVINNPHVYYNAAWTRLGGRSAELTFNIGKIGRKWFERPLEEINALLIHEFGHQYSSNHLSEEYYRALTKVGARFTKVALFEPDILRKVMNLARETA